MEREKLTFSGPLLEADFFPVFDNGRRLPVRGPKTKPSTKEQEKYNKLQADKKFIRLANANFNETDNLLHPTYRPEKAPQSEEEAKRDIAKRLRRIKNRRQAKAKKLREELAQAELAAQAMPGNAFLSKQVKHLQEKIQKLEEPFRYIYVIEKQVYKTGKHKGKANWHFHIFATGGLENREMEKLMGDGMRTNCDNYQPDVFGPEAAAKYMCKDPKGSKRFCCSRNLVRPIEKKRDGKVSRRMVEKMATRLNDDREFWERRYKGYRFLRCYARFNEYNGNWYVSVVLYRTDGETPKWSAEEWLTSDGQADYEREGLQYANQTDTA